MSKNPKNSFEHIDGILSGKDCPGSDRKHTPLTSQAERGLYGTAYGAKKAGKPVPSYVPKSLANEPMALLKMHLVESKGKNLPRRVKKKK